MSRIKNLWAEILFFITILALGLTACEPKTPLTPEEIGAPLSPEAVELPIKKKDILPSADLTNTFDAWEDVDPSGQTVIFWHLYTQERQDAIRDIVGEFNRTNEYGITVFEEYQGGYGDIYNKMLVVLNTPDIPDLIVTYPYQAATYQIADTLLDISTFLESKKWGFHDSEQQDFFPGFWEQDLFPNFGNARLGFPVHRSMEVLYYNTDWLIELGYDGPPTTPDEFKEMSCEAVEQQFSKATAEGSIGFELSIDASSFASWTFAFGGDIFDYENALYNYNSASSVAAMTFLQDLFHDGCARPVKEQYGDQADFGAGITLFTVGSTSGLPFYRDVVDADAQFEWNISAVPHITEEPIINIFGTFVSMAKTTQERELASWLFLKYFTRPEIQVTWSKISNYLPVRISAAKGLQDYFESNPEYETAFELLQYSKYEPPVPGYDLVCEIVEEDMAAIVHGADIIITLDQLNEKSNVILEERMSSIPAASP